MSEYNIFIGYRRKDTAGEAGRMYDRLSATFSHHRVFKDADSIEPGIAFRDHIVSVVNSAEVFLALIGERWNEHAERLNDTEDLVRIELETALQNKVVQVIPVLIGDAQMPDPGVLPDSLRAITTIQAAKVRQDPDFHTDMDRLIESISKRDVSGAVEIVSSNADERRLEEWARIENSLEESAYENFANTYPDTYEAKLALRAARGLDLWSKIDHADLKTVQSFANKIKGRVPEGLYRNVMMQLRILLRERQRIRDYRRHEKDRDLGILNLPADSTRQDWQRRHDAWNVDLSPDRFPPNEHPEVAQKLRRIRLAYNRLMKFG